ncbi:MAG: AAA family ATPase [Gallionella sp.]|nr:AAA family ATPase [Gallionella sp.]
MTDSNLPLTAFAIGGYRSFGDKVQRFGRLSRINLFIGQNNSGKSNILRFLHDVYPALRSNKPLNLGVLDAHLPTRAAFIVGRSIALRKDKQGNYSSFSSEMSPKLGQVNNQTFHLGQILNALLKKAELDGTGENVWFDFGANCTLIDSNWEVAFKVIDDSNLRNLWSSMAGQNGGSRMQHWFPETLRRLTPGFNPINIKMIPAIRQVGKQGSASEEFSGEGIIERLAKLQHPNVHNQRDKEKFEKINQFLRNVIDNDSASIDIPHERDTILVHISGRTLPLESLGTGIHEVIILASAATILEKSIICMEEPELHLNPILQKKLARYLLEATDNQYFITTHSAALMDTPSAEIYHIKLEGGQSIAEHATSDKLRSEICEDLGYHPSDLLQSNCLIWVEGPSDRIYINHWIYLIAPKFVEGIHYSIMFYGGRLASHLTGEDIDKSIESFISLRRLNRRGVIVIDSDKEKKGGRINDTKRRLMGEFDSGPGYTWITEGREIENYLNSESIKDAISKVHPEAKCKSAFGQYENTLMIKTKSGKDSQASKVNVAKYIIENCEADFGRLDLKKQIQRLVDFISDSNPRFRVD